MPCVRCGLWFGDDNHHAFVVGDIQNSFEMSRIIDEINKKNTNNIIKEGMNENFRTDYILLEKINNMFEKDIYYGKDKLKFPKERLKKLEKYKKTELTEENSLKIVFETDIIDVIKYITSNEVIRGNKVKYSDIAILCRSNYDLDSIATKLKKEDIPVEIFGGKGFFRSKEIIDILKF